MNTKEGDLMNVKSKEKHTYNCMVCNKDLEYFQDYRPIKCSYCQDEFQTNVTCVDNHYVCDKCHSMDLMDFIEDYCLKTTSDNPMEIALEIMNKPNINMHGPEHHYLIPAALLSSYYSKIGEKKKLKAKLKLAKTRAKDVKGGFCGFYGNCGAAVGTGIFMSIITQASPLTRESWQDSNMMTANSLMEIAKLGGPRCCKRALFTSITEAAKYVDDRFSIKMYDYENHIPKCTFKSKNKECIGSKCPY